MITLNPFSPRFFESYDLNQLANDLAHITTEGSTPVISDKEFDNENEVIGRRVITYKMTPSVRSCLLTYLETITRIGYKKDYIPRLHISVLKNDLYNLNKELAEIADVFDMDIDCVSLCKYFEDGFYKDLVSKENQLKITLIYEKNHTSRNISLELLLNYDIMLGLNLRSVLDSDMIFTSYKHDDHD